MIRSPLDSIYPNTTFDDNFRFRGYSGHSNRPKSLSLKVRFVPIPDLHHTENYAILPLSVTPLYSASGADELDEVAVGVFQDG